MEDNRHVQTLAQTNSGIEKTSRVLMPDTRYTYSTTLRSVLHIVQMYFIAAEFSYSFLFISLRQCKPLAYLQFNAGSDSENDSSFLGRIFIEICFASGGGIDGKTR